MHGDRGVCRVRAVRSRTLCLAALWLASTLCLAGLGCSSGGGVRVEGNAVAAPNLGYVFGPVAPSWRRIEVPSNDVAWFDPDTRGTIHVDHSCARDNDTPLSALVQHLLLGFTAREFVSEETIPFDGREARHVVLRARLDGVPRALELYVMKKDGCVFDLGYVAPPDRFEQGRPRFEAFVRGFRTTRSPLGPGAP